LADKPVASGRHRRLIRETVAIATHPKANLLFAAGFLLPATLYVIMNSVLSLSGAVHRYRRKNSTAEIRAAER
jgi:hypothetical protein